MESAIEPTAPPVSAGLSRDEGEADDGTRTHDLLHGKQTLYQLSYIRGEGEV
jgi:hypothetical protein